MGHQHSDDSQSFYTDQLCTIALCGAIGGVAIMMWQQDLLKYILKPWIHPQVLIAGIVLLILVAIRAVGLWRSVGPAAGGAVLAHDHHHGPGEKCSHDHGHDCGHDHDHAHDHAHEAGHDCGHDHGHNHDHDHDHDPGHEHEHHHAHSHGPGDDHGHDHGFSPWRYIILLLPVVLYFLNLPNQGFSASYVGDRLKGEQPANTEIEVLAEKNSGEVLDLEFNTLKQAAYLPTQRERFQGQTGRLKGQFLGGPNNRTCSLVRIKMACCAADAIPLNVIVISPDPLLDFKDQDWVEVEGQIQFRKHGTRDEYVPVLQLKSRDKIRATDPPLNPYI